MNERAFRRNGTVSMKTPRIVRQPPSVNIAQNTHQVVGGTQQKGILPLLPVAESVSLAPAKQSFRNFAKRLAAFITHNGATVSFRAQLSQQATEIEHLFGCFTQYIAKIPSLHGSGNRALPFAKAWQAIVLSLLSVRKTGPQTIHQSIQAHLGSVANALDTVTKNGIKASVHDAPFRNCRDLQNQLSNLKKNTNAFLQKPVKGDVLQGLERDFKTFSRALNDSFTREFCACGIAQNEVVRLRTRSYSACCDIIHQLKASFLFEGDMSRLIAAIREFQELMEVVYPKFGIPLSYLVYIEPDECDGETETEAEAVEEETEDYSVDTERDVVEIQPVWELDDSMELADFVLTCQMNREAIKASGVVYADFFRILCEKVTQKQEEIVDESRRKKRLEEEVRNLKHSLESAKASAEGQHEKHQSTVHVLEERTFDLRRAIMDVMMIHGATDVNTDDTDEALMAAVLETCTTRLSKACSNCEKLQTQNRDTETDCANANAKIDELTGTLTVLKKREYEIQKLLETKDDCIDRVRQLTDLEKVLADTLGVSGGDVLKKAVWFVGDSNEARKRLEGIGSGDTLSELVKDVCDEYVSAKEILEDGESTDERLSQLALKFAASSQNSNDGAVSHIISSIVPVAEGTDTEEHAKLCVVKYKKVKKLAEQMKADVRKVMETIGDNAEDLETAVKNYVSRYEGFLRRVSDSLAKLTSSKPEASEVFVSSKIAAIQKRISGDNDTLHRLQSVCSDTEARLAKLVGVTVSKRPIHESISIMFNTLEEQGCSPTALKRIESELSQLVKCDIKASAGKDGTKRISDMIAEVGQRMTGLRKVLNDVAVALSPNYKPASLETKAVVSHIMKSLDDRKDKPGNIDGMFTNVFKFVPVTTRSDYKVYVPELCAAFTTLHESIMALKPFATSLNTIFSQFDCKYSSFQPGSHSYQLLRTQIFALHNALNSLAPSKINSLVFLVLSRFIALFSSFMTALSASAFDSSAEGMKAEFFKLEQENQRLLQSQHQTA